MEQQNDRDIVVEVRSLTRHFGRTAALIDVDLTVPRGCVFGLVGENGAGKTTLIHHLLGLLKAQAGLDAVVRRDILAAIIRTVADEGRTVVFSSHLLDEVERVADEVAMIHKGRLAFQGGMEDIKASHHRLVIRFPEPVEERPAFPEALACEGSGREWSVLCDGELDRMREAIRDIGAEIVLEETPSLEDIFVARVGTRRGALREA